MSLTNDAKNFGGAHNFSAEEVAGGTQPTEPITAQLARHGHRDDPAFTFLDYSTDRQGVPHTLLWSELDTRVRAVSARLRTLSEPGGRVAILTPQDLTYVVGFLGALHAGLIAVPLFAPEVSMHQQRLVGALTDAAPDVWVTSAEAMDGVRALAEEQPVPQPKEIVAVDTLASDEGAGLTPARVDLAEPAYLQYTSGSTREPAGAVISHRAIATNAWQAAIGYQADAATTCTGWIPFFHDMGLLQLLCLPLSVGAHSVFTTPMSFIRKPVRWLRQLADYPKTLSAAPNFAYEYAASKVSEADLAGLDLSGVHVLINGSEPVRATTVATFAKTFAPCGLHPEVHRPSYGLAEATVFVTAAGDTGPVVTTVDRGALADGRFVPSAPPGPATPAPGDPAGTDEPADTGDATGTGNPRGIELVAAGTPVHQHVRVVDPQQCTTMPDGHVGEVWINGPNVADGYWQAPERSAESFDATLHRAADGAPAHGWLRTGDLGAFHEGQLYITGRMKDLIIIDGKNHYPQDIENTVQESHPAIRRDHVAAFGLETDGHESVVVLAELARTSDPVDENEVAKIIRKAVNSRHEVKLHDVVLAPAGSVLRTSSGKIARAANKKRYLAERSTSAAGI